MILEIEIISEKNGAEKVNKPEYSISQTSEVQCSVIALASGDRILSIPSFSKGFNSQTDNPSRKLYESIAFLQDVPVCAAVSESERPEHYYWGFHSPTTTVDRFVRG